MVAAVFADTVFVVVGVIVIDDGYEVFVERVFDPMIVLALVLSLFHICLSALRSKKKNCTNGMGARTFDRLQSPLEMRTAGQEGPFYFAIISFAVKY